MWRLSMLPETRIWHGPNKYLHEAKMNFKSYFPEFGNNQAEVIAFFGQAKLVKTIDFKYELRGGSHDDRISAREWISLFFHDAIVKEV
jgi:hypothetical protein